MERTVEDICESISQTLIKSINCTFSEAILDIELHALALKITGGYQCTEGFEPRPFVFLKEDKKLLMKNLIELHAKTDINEQSHWNIMSFNLYSNGKYKTDFVWNQVLADKIQSIDAEV